MTSLLLPIILTALATPNVVFLSVDTLRADHMGSYGFHRNTTPNLDRLAEDALLFEDAICEQPQTGPSLIAMLSSRVPRVTGAIRNGVPLPSGTPTVAMLFQEGGYETAAIVSNWNLKKNLSGLDRGFANYDADFGKRWWGRKRHEMTADVVTDRALSWLEQRDREKPFFFWVHYMDPHAPYKNKRGFEKQLHGETQTKKANAKSPQDRYQTEIAFVDQEIQRLLDALPKEDTYILFTADHGESLGEHGYWGHTRYIYQATMHIPLFIQGPGINPVRIDRPVRGIDIGPTLLGLAGLVPTASMTGMDLRKTLPEANAPRIFETYGGSVPKGEDVREALATRPPRRQGIIQDGWKLIQNESGDRELYHITEDPAEEHNLVTKHPEKAAALAVLLEDWHQRTPRNQSTAQDLSEDDLQMLEANGYL
ncbi:MAG: sulfatase-like hydrolase/transferase [Candidatus Hydrogenedentes bacterium]|nr:sulfatase-like hydrolase/transferase [Candidatus Hydrogenedentota bacterium]